MASRRMVPDTVTLYNFIGEVNGVATYSATVLSHVCVVKTIGSGLNTQGKQAENSTKLYIFDNQLSAESVTGAVKAFKPFTEWGKLSTADKGQYWTLNEGGDDYFTDGIVVETKPPKPVSFRITSTSRKAKGSPGMWHWEVEGK